MRLSNLFRLRYAGILLLLLMTGAVSYAQSKSAATSITVYQDPG